MEQLSEIESTILDRCVASPKIRRHLKNRDLDAEVLALLIFTSMAPLKEKRSMLLSLIDAGIETEQPAVPFYVTAINNALAHLDLLGTSHRARSRDVAYCISGRAWSYDEAKGFVDRGRRMYAYPAADSTFAQKVFVRPKEGWFKPLSDTTFVCWKESSLEDGLRALAEDETLEYLFAIIHEEGEMWAPSSSMSWNELAGYLGIDRDSLGLDEEKEERADEANSEQQEAGSESRYSGYAIGGGNSLMFCFDDWGSNLVFGENYSRLLALQAACFGAFAQGDIIELDFRPFYDKRFGLVLSPGQLEQGGASEEGYALSDLVLTKVGGRWQCGEFACRHFFGVVDPLGPYLNSYACIAEESAFEAHDGFAETHDLSILRSLRSNLLANPESAERLIGMFAERDGEGLTDDELIKACFS